MVLMRHKLLRKDGRIQYYYIKNIDRYVEIDKGLYVSPVNEQQVGELYDMKSEVIKEFKEWARGSYIGKDGKRHRNLKGFNNMSFQDIESSFSEPNIESDGTIQINSEGTSSKTKRIKGKFIKLRYDVKQRKLVEIHIRGNRYN